MAIEYVGSQTVARVGNTSTDNNNYALTGGLAAAPATNDFVIIALSTATNNRTPACNIFSPGTPAWSNLGLLTVGSQPYDVCLNVSYKFMGATPNTYFQVPSGVHTDDPQCVIVHVYRGVDLTTPFDVTTVSASGIGTTRGDPPPILPVTLGAWVYATVAGGSGTGAAYTQGGSLSAFRQTIVTAEVNDAMLGSGHYPNWAGGEVDIPAYITGSNVANDSWASYVLALRPAGGIVQTGLRVFVGSGHRPPTQIMAPALPPPQTLTRFLAETLRIVTTDLRVVRDTGQVITWEPVFGASDYRIEVGSTPGASDVLVTHTGSSTPSYTLSLPAGTYYVRIYSVGAVGGDWQTNYGPASAEIVITI